MVSFTLRGPNGTHVVLVTDIVVCVSSMLYLDNRNRGPFWNKNAAHGLTQALVSLHATGIVHGGALSLSFCKGYRSPTLDLNIGNFSFAFSQIADQDPSDVIQDLAGDHDMIVVLPISVVHQTPSLPAYVLTPCDLAKYYDKIAGKDVPQTKIIDFGSGEPYFSG